MSIIWSVLFSQTKAVSYYLDHLFYSALKSTYLHQKGWVTGCVDYFASVAEFKICLSFTQKIALS